MFSVRAFSRLLSLVVALAMMVGLAPAVHTQIVITDEYYRPVELDGVRVGFGNYDDPWERRYPGEYVNLDLYPGELYRFFAVLWASGLEETLNDVRFTITYGKGEGLATVPEFPDHPEAVRKETREDDSAYYADYYFDTVERGADIRIPLEIQYPNGTTVSGLKNRVSVDMYVGGIPFINNSILFRTGTLGVYGNSVITEGDDWYIGFQEYSVPAHRFFVEDLETQGWRTPAEGAAITYQLKYHLDSEISGEGDVFNDRYRLVVNLDEYTKPHPESLAAGWVHDEAAGTLTFEADTATTECTERDDRGELWNCKSLKLLFVHAPVATDNTWNGPHRWYSPEVEASYFYQGKLVGSYQNSLTSIAFVPAELPAEGRTHEVTAEKQAVTLEKDYRRNISENLTVSNGKLYAGEVSLSPGGSDPAGLRWSTFISQRNNGTGPGEVEWPEKATGGIKDHLHRIVEQDLDPRLYFLNFTLRASTGSAHLVSSLSGEEVLDRINSSQNVLWGVTASGDKVELARNIDADQMVEINDDTRRLDKIELEFLTELEMDNFYFYIDVAAYPLAEEIAKWDRQEYPEKQLYPSTTFIDYRSDEDDQTHAKRSTASHTLHPTTRVMGVGTGSTEVRVQYPTCTKEGQPAFAVDLSVTCNQFNEWRMYSFTSSPLNAWGQYDKPVRNLKHIYFIPPEFGFGGLSHHWVYSQYKGPEPKIEVIENFHGTGKTAVILSMGDVIHSFGRYNDDTTTGIRVLDKLETAAGTYQLEGFAVWDNNDEILPHDESKHFSDVYDFDNDGDTQETFLRVTNPLVYERPGQVVATKKASVDGVTFQEGTVHQEINGPVEFEITVTNNSDRQLRDVTVADVFPRTDDFRWGSDGEPLQPREWSLDGETKQHSGFNVPLTGPVTDITLMRGGVARAIPAGYVSYALTPAAGDFSTWKNQTWVSAAEVTDWEQVIAMRLNNRYLTLHPGDSLIVKTRNVVRSQQADLPEGTTAVNHAVFGNPDNVSETQPVYIQIARYRVNGIAFEDLDGNGIQSGDDEVIANVPFTVVDATTGDVVTDAEGSPIAGVTNDQGEYSVEIPRSGEYRIRFEKQAGQIFATVGDGANASHVAVCADAADNLSGSGGVVGLTARATGLGNEGATDGNCTSRYAKSNNFGWTNAFVLNPSNVAETRNVGLGAPLGTVVIKKKDQYNEPVAGAEFTLTWKAPTGAAPENPPAPKTAVTNDNGELVFNNVPLGEYTLSESGVPAGYRGLDTPIDLVVVEDMAPVEVSNHRIEGQVVVTKVDSKTQAPIAGAQFELQSKAGEVIRAAVATNDQGQVVFGGIRPGDYQVVETHPAAGYHEPVNPVHPVTIPADGQGVAVEVTNARIAGEVSFIKADGPTGEPLPGAVFNLQTPEGVVLDVQSSDTDGRVVFGDVVPGTYHLVETRAPEGYQGLAHPLVFEMNSKGEPVDLGEVGNEKLRGTIEFTKVDQLTGAPIAGAVFSLLQGGQVAAVAESDSSGLVRFSDVVRGSYVLKETQVPAGYVLDSQQREVVVKGSDRVVLDNVVNVPIVSTVFFTKVDASTHKPIAGARFGLFNDRAEQLAEVTTDSTGRVAFEKVRPGTYTVVELEAPQGYERIAEPMDVTVGVTGDPVDMGEVANRKLVGAVSLTKVDAQSQKPLAGAVFELRQGDLVLAEQTTGEDGVVTFEGLDLGYYTVTEKAPAPGYTSTPEARGVQLTEDQLAVNLGTVENTAIEPGDSNPGTKVIEFLKVDAETTKPLAGATFALLRGGQELARATSGEDGLVRFEVDQGGDYTVVEVAAPTGYQLLADPIPVTPGANEVQVANERIRGDIELKAVAKATQLPLGGAEFDLQTTSGEVVATVTSNDKGMLVFSQQLWGRYTLVESKEPAGFLPTGAQIPVAIDVHGEVVHAGVVEYEKHGAISTNPPGPGDLWKVFIPLIALMGLGGHGSSDPNPDPGGNPVAPMTPAPPQPGERAPATPVAQAPAPEQEKGGRLAATGSPVLGLMAIAVVLVLVGGLAIRRRG